MKRTVIINFPDDFEFQPKFDSYRCEKCYFFDMDNEYWDEDCCTASSDGETCPFYKNDDVVELNVHMEEKQ